MSAWVLVPDLVSLRTELNKLAPGRDKASDGAIGDTAHAGTGNSDHLGDEDYPALRAKDTDKVNEVHAVDVDDDLRKTGWTMDRVVQIIVTRHRTGLDNRLQYVIWNRRIWSRSWGWTAKVYTGVSPHTEHAHFSALYGAGTAGNPEVDTKPWGLLAADLPAVKPGGKAEAKPGSRLLKKAMSGADVAFLRRWLGLSAGTVFDTALDRKVRDYQRMRGLTVDGVCGRVTFANMGVKVTF